MAGKLSTSIIVWSFFFSFFLFLSASRRGRSRQATQRISINYPRLRFPRSQAVLKERGRPGGTDDGSGGAGALELGDEEKKSPRRAMQSGPGVGRPASASLDLDRLAKLPWIFFSFHWVITSVSLGISSLSCTWVEFDSFSAPLNKAQVYGSMNSIEVVNVELAPSVHGLVALFLLWRRQYETKHIGLNSG